MENKEKLKSIHSKRVPWVKEVGERKFNFSNGPSRLVPSRSFFTLLEKHFRSFSDELFSKISCATRFQSFRRKLKGYNFRRVIKACLGSDVLLLLCMSTWSS